MALADNSTCVPTLRSHIVFASWLVVYLLVFPVFIYVIYIGYKKWKALCPNTSHSDAFTYHMVAMEFLNAVGSGLYFVGFMAQFQHVLNAGLSLKHMVSIGEIFFHDLTCMERYLAVVHPITYLRLKKRGGLVIRNVSIGCAWLFSITSLALAIISAKVVTEPLIFGSAVAVLSTALVSFCSVSVVCVLVRPGPGDGGAIRKKVDHSKRVAVYTILVILGALLLRMVAVCFYFIASFNAQIEVCIVVVCTYWFAMPSSLVLPLLYLQRHGLVSGHWRVHKESGSKESGL